MNENPMMFFVYIIAFLVAVGIARLVFSIPALLRHMKVQTNLLRAIAENSGVEGDRINEIMTGLMNSVQAYDEKARKANQKNK